MAMSSPAPFAAILDRMHDGRSCHWSRFRFRPGRAPVKPIAHG
jgi:hypothetical protein